MDEYFEVFMRENYRKFVAYCISRGEDSADADADKEETADVTTDTETETTEEAAE